MGAIWHIIALAGQRPVQLDEMPRVSGTGIHFDHRVAELRIYCFQHALGQSQSIFIVWETNRNKEMSAIARIRAAVVLPTPRGPVSR